MKVLPHRFVYAEDDDFNVDTVEKFLKENDYGKKENWEAIDSDTFASDEGCITEYTGYWVHERTGKIVAVERKKVVQLRSLITEILNARR